MDVDFLTGLWGPNLAYAFKIIAVFYPIWLPIVLGTLFADVWFRYIRMHFIQKQGSVLLEIRLPREITKSPAAMEVFFTSLQQTGSANFIESFYNGKVRPWFSFEIASFSGQIHFYIWAWKKWRNHIESQLYAQYPEIEIYEAPDYTVNFRHDPDNSPFWATYFQPTKKGGDAYPIKTYIEYGLEKDPKEEFKIDPMTSVLEYMGSIKQGEQVWIQILIQAYRKLTLKDDATIKKNKKWDEIVKEEKKKLIESLKPNPEAPPRIPTAGENKIFEAIDRNAHKIPFEVAIRGFYIGQKGSFNDHNGIAGLIGSFRQYNSNELNGFKLGKFTDFDYPWEDFRRMRRNTLEKKMLDAYKRRSFFQPPHKHWRQKPFIMTTEELATIYHFPGQVAQTPTIQRVPSKKSQAPTNLPV